MADEWADAMNEFRSAVYAALDAGCTPGDLIQDIEDVEAEGEA